MITDSSTILDGVLEHSISIYTEEGETREGLIEKFAGDKIKLVQWLRERAFAKDIPIEAKSKPAENKKEVPMPALKKKRASKKSKPDDNKNQNEIF